MATCAKHPMRAWIETNSLPGEVWKVIVDFPDYLISSFGRVASMRRGAPRIMRGGRGTTPMKYLRVTLRGTKGIVNRNIHSLVAAHFLPGKPVGGMALHRDGVVGNCRVDNLYWGTSTENAKDRIAHGRSGKRQANPNAKLTDSQVAEIRSLYSKGDVRQVDLAVMFGVEQAHVSRIIRQTSWT